MGEVYRARDPGLGREVALKLLLEEVAGDPERLARFDREARVLASLNHPNIATLHGFEADRETRFLVMELVSGETLADRIARGPVLVGEAVALFLQIADALEAAHEKGIVHRDLKPANVKVSADGRVKVLDFGLAKAMAPETASASNVALSASPTMTLAATMRGEILGTAGYMSPEQASGKVVDKRTDVWAFGVCLFETLTGRRTFDGEDAANTLAAVLRDPIALERLPATCPPRLRRLLERCLVRDPRQRLRDIGDARFELAAVTGDAAEVESPRNDSAGRSARSKPWLWAAAGAVLGALVAFGVTRLLSPAPSPPWSGRPVSRSTIDVSGLYPEPSVTTEGSPVGISRDGSMLTLAAGIIRSRLYSRRIDDEVLQLLPGTENSWCRVSFSPDGEWFVHWKWDGGLWKTPRNGGPSVRLAEAKDYWGGDWDGNESFVYVPDSGSGVHRIAASGGTPERVTTVDAAAGEISHRYPAVLPGGESFLYSLKLGSGPDDWRIVARSFAGGDTVTLVEGGFDGRYAASGHLVYGSGGSLYAVPMDIDPVRITGRAVRVIEDIVVSAQGGIVSYSFSEDGTLVYIPRSAQAAFETQLHWVDRGGKRELVSLDRRNFGSPRLSPDGSRLAVTVTEQGGFDIRVYDLARGVASRLTTVGDNGSPVWTPDGRRIVFHSNRSGAIDLYWMAADGSGDAEPLTRDVDLDKPSSIGPDGTLAFTRPGGANDIWTLKLGSGEKPSPFLATPEDEANAAFSPDGKWIAYELVEGGRPEIYVQPFPSSSHRVKISAEGGVGPVWSPASKELFYMENGKRLMAVPYEIVGGDLRPGVARPLFEAPTRVTGEPKRLFDVAPDGKRFVLPDAADLAKVKVVLVQNWFAELERLAPPAGSDR